ncbi:MAG: TetR family transcriptional regulator [Micromonosporaceae bacterium]|nr:TetR family transcriptional regulator [Micromonosporaceae bacterium]
MTTGLRERKKAATREALHEAAMRLATENGVEHVTVEAIADAASVSRRTFSNYFASKEQALLHGERARLDHLIELVRARPAAEPPWAALTHAAQAWVAEFAAEDRHSSARYRRLRRHPSLLAEQVAIYAAAERELALAMADRIPAGRHAHAGIDATLRARLLAANYLNTLRVAAQVWLDHPSRTLPGLVREALAVTGEKFH